MQFDSEEFRDNFSEEANEQGLLFYLDYIGKLKELVPARAAQYQTQVKKHYDKRVCPRGFKKGDHSQLLVLSSSVLFSTLSSALSPPALRLDDLSPLAAPRWLTHKQPGAPMSAIATRSKGLTATEDPAAAEGSWAVLITAHSLNRSHAPIIGCSLTSPTHA
ncbi:hypothetical protein ACLOJK_028370 [Asimina triloba]